MGRSDCLVLLNYRELFSCYFEVSDNRNLLNTAVNTEPAFFIWLFKVITPDLFFILFYFISFSVSAKGIHVAESLNWNLKAVWMCYGP